MKTIIQKMIKETKIDFIDCKPYGNTQKFRLPYSSKDENDNRPYIMDNTDDDILDHIIQVNNHNETIYGPDQRVEENPSEIAKADRRLKTIDPILKNLDESFYEEYDNWWKIGQAISNYMGNNGKEAFKEFSAKSKKWLERHNATFEKNWEYFMKNTMANKYKSFN